MLFQFQTPQMEVLALTSHRVAEIPVYLSKVGVGMSKVVLWKIPAEHPAAAGNSGDSLFPPPLASPFPARIHDFTNKLFLILFILYFVFLTRKLRKYSDKLEVVLLHKNEKLPTWFCDIVLQLQFLGDRRNC